MPSDIGLCLDKKAALRVWRELCVINDMTLRAECSCLSPKSRLSQKKRPHQWPQTKDRENPGMKTKTWLNPFRRLVAALEEKFRIFFKKIENYFQLP
jgi:hypothetical protein